MSDEQVGEILANIGRLAVRDSRTEQGSLFVYAEAESMSVAASIFIELPDHVIYRSPSGELMDLILEAWYAADTDKKWKALFYTVVADSFDARFRYEDETWDDEEDFAERRPIVLRAKYGDKPIDYDDP